MSGVSGGGEPPRKRFPTKAECVWWVPLLKHYICISLFSFSFSKPVYISGIMKKFLVATRPQRVQKLFIALDHTMSLMGLEPCPPTKKGIGDAIGLQARWHVHPSLTTKPCVYDNAQDLSAVHAEVQLRCSQLSNGVFNGLNFKKKLFRFKLFPGFFFKNLNH